jgi:hypothetical protein
MSDTFQYRLSNDQKSEIAQNLIDIFKKDAKITKQASAIHWQLDSY